MNSINQKSVTVGEVMPSFSLGSPLLVEGCMVAQCIGGNATLSLDFREHIIREGDVVFLFNDMVVMLEEHSPDFKIRYINLDAAKAYEIYFRITSSRFWSDLYLSPVKSFKGAVRQSFDRWFEQCLYVRHECMKETVVEVISKLVLLLFITYEDIVEQSPQEIPSMFNSAAWKIQGEFFVLLSRYYKSHHNVAFYASELNISPDHLNSVIRDCTRRSAKETIEAKLILAMKALLENTNMTVKEIAQRLHYEDSSYMCRVFRKYEGMSPLEYRKKQ